MDLEQHMQQHGSVPVSAASAASSTSHTATPAAAAEAEAKTDASASAGVVEWALRPHASALTGAVVHAPEPAAVEQLRAQTRQFSLDLSPRLVCLYSVHVCMW